MSDFRKKYADLFQFHEELRGILEPILNKHPEPTNPKQGFLLYALVKSHKTQAAILLLSERGFGQDAGILSRSIFELAITALYIVKDNTGKIAERFFDYDLIMRANMYNAVSKDTKYKYELKTKDPTGVIIEDVIKEAKKVKEKYQSIGSLRWSDENFKEMAEAVGRSDTYKTAYRLQCNLSHPNPRNTIDYFTESEGALEVNAGPDNKWILESLVATFDFFFCVINAWNEEFEFKLKPALDDLSKRFSAKMKEIDK